jgi:hypothetical protein
MKIKFQKLISADRLKMHRLFLETTLKSTTFKSVLKPSILKDDIVVNTGIRLKGGKMELKFLYLDQTC